MYHILCIEDDLVDQMAFKRMVEDHGAKYEVTFAKSIAQASDLITHEDYNVIISDFQLGDGTAFDIVEKAEDIPVIFVTGEGNEEIAVKAMKAGALDYVIKDVGHKYLNLLPLSIERAIGHQRAKQELKLSEERFKDLFESSNDLIQSVSPEGQFLYVNPAWLKTLKYTEEEIKTLHFLDIIHPDSKDHCISLFKEINNGIQFSGVEVTFVDKEGESILVEGNLSSRLKNGLAVATRGIFRNVTDKKLAQEKLRANERFIRDVIDNVPDLIFVKNLDGKITLINKTGASILYDKVPEDVVGKYHQELHEQANENEFVKERDQLLLSQELPIKYEIEYTKPNGETAWLFTEKRLFKDATGTQYILGISNDITERKIYENTLTAIRQRYDLAADAGKTGVCDWQLDDDEFYIDPKLKSLLGYSDDEIANDKMAWIGQIHPEDRDMVSNKVVNFVNGKLKDYELEYRMMHKDDSTRWFLERANKINDDSGNILRLISALTDITEHKKVEEELRISEEQYRLLVESANDIIYKCDHRGNFQYINNRIYELGGFKREEFVGKHFTDFVHEDDREKVMTFYLAQVNKKKEITYQEFRVKTKEGQLKWVGQNVRALFAEEAKETITGFLAIVRDITEYKRLENALKSANEELEVRVSERTKALTDANQMLKREIALREETQEALEKTKDDYKGLFQNAHDPIIIFSPESEKVIEVNSMACKVYGFTKREFKKLSILDISAEPEIGKKRIANTLKKGVEKGFETIQYDKAGNELHIEVSASRINYQGGIAILSINRNVSARKRIESILQQERQMRVSAIIDAQESERKKFSRDIHDGLGQLLTAAKLSLRGILKSNVIDGSEKETISYTQNIIDNTIDEARRISHDLMPNVLNDFGLQSALQKLVDQSRVSSNIKIGLDVDGNINRLSAELEVGLYRIAQEAINNAVKHSKASSVNVSLSKLKSGVRLQIRDDGIGLREKSPNNGSGGSGLNNMQERARLLNSTIKISGAAGKGTTVLVEST